MLDVVVSMEPGRPKFIPKTRRSLWSSRTWNIIRYYSVAWKQRPLAIGFLATLSYLIAFNMLVRYWKGAGHPVNRFVWRIRKRNNDLPPELLEKEKVVTDYFHSRIRWRSE
ncbi:hypothetical protein AB6A40_009573 [Gnathostoma spinigerum]|uniref:Uncharacterized protein n=1 Tax=Gnathostoma spinigerum TaxID=75299 RepID=A0ABD6EZT4_9BILA